jgi:hypothetical protein
MRGGGTRGGGGFHLSMGGGGRFAPRPNFGAQRFNGLHRFGGFRPNFAFHHGRAIRPGFSPVFRPGSRPCGFGRCHVTSRWHHWPPRYWGGYEGGGYVGGGVAMPATYAPAPASVSVPVGQAVAAPAAPCTCLRKEYTHDGQVVFSDLCTNEAAAAPLGNQAQAQPQR